MNTKCEIIRDLLPSYLDNLTSEASNKLVNEHLILCKDCKQYYTDMKQDLAVPMEEDADKLVKSEKKLMRRIKNRIITVIVTLVITFTFLGIIIGSFGNVIFQEGNPIPIISSIIKLNFSDEEFVKFDDAPDRYISEYNPSEVSYRVVKDFMKERQWSFKEQMGSGLIFEKDGEQLVIPTRQYTKNYYIWTIPDQETKQ